MLAVLLWVVMLVLAPILAVWARVVGGAVARYGRIRAARNRDHASVPRWSELVSRRRRIRMSSKWKSAERMRYFGAGSQRLGCIGRTSVECQTTWLVFLLRSA